MTREELFNEFEIKNKIIVNPGKFEGEYFLAPLIYEAYLDGIADSTVEDYLEVNFDEGWEGDYKEFPELMSFRKATLTLLDNGFVSVDWKLE